MDIIIKICKFEKSILHFDRKRQNIFPYKYASTL